jgi:hypothetical protein
MTLVLTPMTRIHLIAVFSTLVAACGSTGGSAPGGSGGSTSGSGGSPAGTGGAASGAGGSAIGSGGAASGTGGSATSTGGATTASGGSAPRTGGATGSSGGSTGSGGSVPGTGGATGSSGGATGTGGAPRTGGTTGSSGGSTGTGGATTGTGGATTVPASELWVSPAGDDVANDGTMAKPYYTLAKAVTRAQAGTVINMRGGTFNYKATIPLAISGTAAAPIKVQAYAAEKPVLDFTMQPYGADNRGILLTGNYWVLLGLEISNAGDNGVKVEGSHNRIERCIFHHNGDSGIQLGFGHETVNPNGENCSYNEVINCDSYMNFDVDSRGGDADGFACKMHNGKGNVFRGCRSWHNADDGWDLYETDWPVEISNCWAWHNGDQTDFEAIYMMKTGKKMSSFSGNGNGFKLGGNGTGGSSQGTHIAKNCVSFGNNFRSKKGFDQNSHKGGVRVLNSVAWGNGYNFMFEEDPNSGLTNEFTNNVSFMPGTSLGMEFSGGAVLKNNSWQAGVTVDATDFVDLTEASAMAPRNADGTLPNNGFARLTAGSDLIDKGVDVGIPFTGAAPDLGAYER